LAEKMGAAVCAIPGEDATEKIFAEGHAAGRGGDGERQFTERAAALRVKESGGSERFAGGGDGQAGGAGQTAGGLGGKMGQGWKAGAGGVMAAATGGVEEIERDPGVAAGEEGVPRDGKIFSQRRDGAQTSDDDAAAHGIL
jgi:hypothetical protein